MANYAGLSQELRDIKLRLQTHELAFIEADNSTTDHYIKKLDSFLNEWNSADDDKKIYGIIDELKNLPSDISPELRDILEDLRSKVSEAKDEAILNLDDIINLPDAPDVVEAAVKSRIEQARGYLDAANKLEAQIPSAYSHETNTADLENILDHKKDALENITKALSSIERDKSIEESTLEIELTNLKDRLTKQVKELPGMIILSQSIEPAQPVVVDEPVGIQITSLPYLPPKVDLNDVTEETINGKTVLALISKDKREKILELLKDKPDGRYSKTGKGGENVIKGLGTNYSIIKSNGQCYAIYYGQKTGKEIGAGAYGVVKSIQNLETLDWRVDKIMSQAQIKKLDSLYDKKVVKADARTEVAQVKAAGRNIEMPKHKYAGSKGRHYDLIMDEARGVDLEKFANATALSMRGLPTKRWLQLFQETLKELQTLHAMNIVHRDVKPANIHIDPRTGKVTILDLGGGGKMENGKVIERNLVGTRVYLAPEILQAEKSNQEFVYSKQTDAYALGATMADVFGFRDDSFNLRPFSELENDDMVNLLFPDKSKLKEIYDICAGLLDSQDKRLTLDEAAAQISTLQGAEADSKREYIVVDIAELKNDPELLDALIKTIREYPNFEKVLLMDTDPNSSVKERMRLRDQLEATGIRVSADVYIGTDVRVILTKMTTDVNDPNITLTPMSGRQAKDVDDLLADLDAHVSKSEEPKASIGLEAQLIAMRQKREPKKRDEKESLELLDKNWSKFQSTFSNIEAAVKAGKTMQDKRSVLEKNWEQLVTAGKEVVPELPVKKRAQEAATSIKPEEVQPRADSVPPRNFSTLEEVEKDIQEKNKKITEQIESLLTTTANFKNKYWLGINSNLKEVLDFIKNPDLSTREKQQYLKAKRPLVEGIVQELLNFEEKRYFDSRWQQIINTKNEMAEVMADPTKRAAAKEANLRNNLARIEAYKDQLFLGKRETLWEGHQVSGNVILPQEVKSAAGIINSLTELQNTLNSKIKLEPIMADKMQEAIVRNNARSDRDLANIAETGKLYNGLAKHQAEQGDNEAAVKTLYEGLAQIDKRFHPDGVGKDDFTNFYDRFPKSDPAAQVENRQNTEIMLEKALMYEQLAVLEGDKTNYRLAEKIYLALKEISSEHDLYSPADRDMLIAKYDAAEKRLRAQAQPKASPKIYAADPAYAKLGEKITLVKIYLERYKKLKLDDKDVPKGQEKENELPKVEALLRHLEAIQKKIQVSGQLEQDIGGSTLEKLASEAASEINQYNKNPNNQLEAKDKQRALSAIQNAATVLRNPKFIGKENFAELTGISNFISLSTSSFTDVSKPLDDILKQLNAYKIKQLKHTRPNQARLQITDALIKQITEIISARNKNHPYEVMEKMAEFVKLIEGLQAGETIHQHLQFNRVKQTFGRTTNLETIIADAKENIIEPLREKFPNSSVLQAPANLEALAKKLDEDFSKPAAAKTISANDVNQMISPLINYRNKLSVQPLSKAKESRLQVVNELIAALRTVSETMQVRPEAVDEKLRVLNEVIANQNKTIGSHMHLDFLKKNVGDKTSLQKMVAKLSAQLEPFIKEKGLDSELQALARPRPKNPQASR